MAGSLGRPRSRTLTWPIHTDPSPVRTSTAPRLRCRIAPGGPGGPERTGPGCASYTETGVSTRVVRTPGEPSAALIRRTIIAVGSDQQNSRSDWRISGRSLPRTSSAVYVQRAGRKLRSAALATTSCTRSIAAWVTGPLYRLLLRGGSAGIGNVR